MNMNKKTRQDINIKNPKLIRLWFFLIILVFFAIELFPLNIIIAVAVILYNKTLFIFLFVKMGIFEILSGDENSSISSISNMFSNFLIYIAKNVHKFDLEKRVNLKDREEGVDINSSVNKSSSDSNAKVVYDMFIENDSAVNNDYSYKSNSFDKPKEEVKIEKNKKNENSDEYVFSGWKSIWDDYESVTDNFEKK